MKIRYTPFSERMVIDQPVKGLDFANDMIQTYFMMSLRYRECYYKQRPQGNTVYYMNYSEASLLFILQPVCVPTGSMVFELKKKREEKHGFICCPSFSLCGHTILGEKREQSNWRMIFWIICWIWKRSCQERWCHFISFFPLYRRNVFLFVRRSGFLIVVQLNMLKKIIYW